MATLGAAKAVSPLIRFGRYAALITGFAYGSFRYSQLSRKEVGVQEEENAIRARRDVRLSAEKGAKDAAEMGALGKECGVVGS